MTVYILYKRSRQFRELVSFGQGINRGRYFRLMALSSIDAFGSIPLATYIVVRNVKMGVVPWNSWADTHSYYSHIRQISAFVWKDEPLMANGLEMFRWLIVACAFIFFAFFGFGDEARKHYHLAYTSITRRIGYSTSSGTLHDSLHGYAIWMCWFDSWLISFQHFKFGFLSHEEQRWGRCLVDHNVRNAARHTGFVHRRFINKAHIPC